MKPISDALYVIRHLVFVKQNQVTQMGFDLSQYETVDERLHRFKELYPNSRVFTELVAYSNEQYIVKANTGAEAFKSKDYYASGNAIGELVYSAFLWDFKN